MFSTFNDEFASAPQWAAMYRGLGLQVVPAHRPGEGEQWKRPFGDWLEFRDSLTPDPVFNRWFHPETGEHRARRNMGLILGRASGGVFAIDLDTYKPGALEWWVWLVNKYSGGMDPQTWTQVTGGGGLQVLFRAPPGWDPPTFKTSLGVDVRGQGGFIIVPPSLHQSQRIYDWKAGFEPWASPLMEAPDWPIEALEQLREDYGHAPGGVSPERTPSPERMQNAFGRDVDGRETKLRDLVWAALVDLYRECPIPPALVVQEAEIERLWGQYEATTKSRLEGGPGESNADLLEREGRGRSELVAKWAYALRSWDTKIAEAAAEPKPASPLGDGGQDRTESISSPALGGQGFPGGALDPQNSTLDATVYPVLSMADLAAMPDVEWLVKDALPQGGLALLFGAPGSFKTFIALDLAMSLAYDEGGWLERPAPKGAGVLYIASEGASGLYRRILAWRKKHKVDEDSDGFHLIREAMSFMNPADMVRLARTVEQHSAKYGRPGLIVVDTVSRVLPGVDENLQKDMTVFIAACDHLRLQSGAAVIGVHHTNKSGEMRGSSVLGGAADSIFRVERGDGEQTGMLICEKQKDAEDGWRRCFKATLEEWFTEGKIEPVRSLSIDWATGRPEAVSGPIWPDRAVLKAMQWFIHANFEKGEPLSTAKQTVLAGRHAPTVLAAKFDLRAPIITDVIQTWLNSGVIEIRTTSSHTKLRGLEVVKWLD